MSTRPLDCEGYQFRFQVIAMGWCRPYVSPPTGESTVTAGPKAEVSVSTLTLWIVCAVQSLPSLTVTTMLYCPKYSQAWFTLNETPEAMVAVSGTVPSPQFTK